MSELHVSLRDLDSQDIPAGLRLCRHAGWNQLAADWELFLELSPSGCRAAVHEGQVVGTVTTVNYENRFAWVGMVLVDPEYRSQGIGTRLLEESLRILSDVPCVRLDATPQGRPVYHRLLFNDEYQLSRMQIDLSETDTQAIQARAVFSARATRESDLPAIFEIDRGLFGADRSRILRWALKKAPEYAWLCERQSNIQAYCFGRHGFRFDQIGPLFASTQALAEALVVACFLRHKNPLIVLDPLHHSSEWLAWLQGVGFVHQRPFTRMYRGQNRYPGQPMQQWAIFGPEFG